MILLPSGSTSTDTLLPYTTLFRRRDTLREHAVPGWMSLIRSSRFREVFLCILQSAPAADGRRADRGTRAGRQFTRLAGPCAGSSPPMLHPPPRASHSNAVSCPTSATFAATCSRLPRRVVG